MGKHGIAGRRAQLVQKGWRSQWTEARATGRGGNSGGTLLAWGRQHFVQQLLGEGGFAEKQDANDDWAIVVWNMVGLRFAVGVVYLDDSAGLNKANLAKLHTLGAALAQLRVPFLIYGDWQLEPPELMACGWVQKLGALVLPPAGCQITCTTGRGRLLD